MPDQYESEEQDEHQQRANRIYDTYFTTCLHYAYNKLRDKHATEEIVLPVFTAIYRNPAITRKLQHQPPLPYLKRAINNGIADWWNQQAREKKQRKHLAMNLPEEQGKNKEEAIIERELTQQLYKLIEDLSDQRRTVMRLHLEGYKSAEIAAMLEIEQQTVRNIRAQSIKLMQTAAKERGFTPWMLLLAC